MAKRDRPSPLKRIAASLESLGPELAATFPTMLSVVVPPMATMHLSQIADSLASIARALEDLPGRPPRPPPHLVFLTYRDRAWVQANMGEEGRFRFALMDAMTDPPGGPPAPYHNLYDVFQQGRAAFVRQPKLGSASARRMSDLFAEWRVDGDGWWRR